MEPAVLFDLDDAGIATITLNRPDMRNPISGDEVVSGLCDTLEAMEANPKVRVAILTGAGKAFSSGGAATAIPLAARPAHMPKRDGCLLTVLMLSRLLPPPSLHMQADAAVRG